MSRRKPPHPGEADEAAAAEGGFRDAVGPVAPLKPSRRRSFARVQMAAEQAEARQRAAAGGADGRRNALTFRDHPAPDEQALSAKRFAAAELGGPGPSDLAVEVGPEDILSWRRDGVQPRVLRRLRKGDYPVSGELDLHGRTVAQAQGDLLSFLQQAVAEGRRCLLIVHGKSASSAAPARLKNCLNAWLRAHPQVNAFHSAKQEDGGAGAVYVYMGKRKPNAAKGRPPPVGR